MTKPTAKQIQRFKTDPPACREVLVIPSASGPRPFGECMGEADFQRERFTGIDPALLAVAKGDKPPIGRYWWEATKGASKDSDLAVCLLWLLAFTRRPLACQVGAADQDQAGELRKAAKDILRLNPWLAERVDVQQWRLVCSGTDSTCEIIAADVAGSHGARPDVLILNELSHVTKQEFAENLLDNAAKVPHGLVVLATNAGFIGTYQAKWREIALTSDRWATHIYSRPSPWLDPAEMEEAKRRNSQARYLRLWHGVWASGQGDALDLADIEAAVDRALLPLVGRDPVRSHLAPGIRWPTAQPVDRPVRLAFAAGLDLGIKHDHSALVVTGTNPLTRRIRLADCRNWAPSPVTRKIDLEQVEHAVLDAHRRFRLSVVNYDPYQAELMAQRLRKQGVPMREVTFTGNNLNNMASTLLETFRSRCIDMYDCPRLVADLQRLTIVEKSYGYKLEATRDADGHADTATGLALALLSATTVSSTSTGGWGGIINTSDGFDVLSQGTRFASGGGPAWQR